MQLKRKKDGKGSAKIATTPTIIIHSILAQSENLQGKREEETPFTNKFLIEISDNFSPFEGRV